MFINAKARIAADEGKLRLRLRYPLIVPRASEAVKKSLFGLLSTM
jgi:hypothetical protein